MEITNPTTTGECIAHNLPVDIPQGLPVGMIIYDADMIILDWNSRATEIFGFEKDEALGRNIVELLVPGDLTEQIGLWRQKAGESNYSLALYYRVKTKDQGQISSHWHTTTIIEKDRTSCFISFVEKAGINLENLLSHDSSSALQDALSESEFNLVFNTQTLTFEYVNPKLFYALSLIGRFPTLTSDHVLKLIPKPERFRIIRHFNRCLENRTNVNTWFHLQVGHNIVHRLMVNGRYLEIGSQKLFVLLVRILNSNKGDINSDIFDQDLSRPGIFPDSDLHRNRNKLEILGDLTAGVVHEINQPLGVIKIILDSFRHKLSSGTLTKEYLEDKTQLALTSVNRISELIDEIRMFRQDARGNTGRLNINKMVHRVIDLLKMSFAKDRIKIIESLDRNLPLIVANEKLLITIISNLLANSRYSVVKKASHYSNTDYVKEIRIASWYDDECVYLQVADNGLGIRKKHMANLFDPFFSTKGADGSGLGLAIVKNYVHELNGKIEVDSKESMYASFTISFQRID